MKIENGVLVIDTSMYVHHLNIQELIDGGVVSAVLGLYKYWDGKQWVLHPNCKRQLDQIVSDGRLVLQTYYYYYPELDPIKEADWFLTAMQGYPVKFAWEDAENHDHPMTPLLRSEQFRRFMVELHTHFSQSGVYTNASFVNGYAPEMSKWISLYPSWIAEYGHQPKTRTMIDWDTFKKDWLPDYNIDLATGQLPGLVAGHQFSGDVFMLPGIYDNGFTMNTILYKNRMPDDISEFRPDFIADIKAGSPIVVVTLPLPQPQVSVKPTMPYFMFKVMPAVNPNVHETSDPKSKIMGYLFAGTEVFVDTNDQVFGYSHIQPVGLFTNGGWVKSSYLVLEA